MTADRTRADIMRDFDVAWEAFRKGRLSRSLLDSIADSTDAELDALEQRQAAQRGQRTERMST